jgi:hypothetical protein
MLVPMSVGAAVTVTTGSLHSPAVGLLLGWGHRGGALHRLAGVRSSGPGRRAEQAARRAATIDPDRLATDLALLSARSPASSPWPSC